MKEKLKTIIAVMLCAILVIGSAQIKAEAAVYDYTGYSLRFETPDGTIAMSQDTSKNSDVWAQAGVKDPSAKLDEFKNMGVVAAFYDPETATTVNFISKTSQKSVEIFNFLDMSDEEIIDFVKELLGENADVELEVGLYEHKQTRFFRMHIRMINPDRPATEVIYGTIMNGQMIQFDIFHEGLVEIDDSFARKIVDNLEFTQILTYEEYEELQHKSLMKLLFAFIGIIAVFVVIIFFSRRSRKNSEELSKRISERMQDFRERKKKGEVDMNGPEVFTAQGRISAQSINDFVNYDTWFRHFFRVASCTLVLAAVAILMFKSGATFYAIVSAGVTLFLLYRAYSQGEKRKESMRRQYDAASTPTATYHFYGEYFTRTGIGTITDFIYGQITEVRRYRSYIYIYMGDLALIVDAGSQSDPGQFVDYLRGKMAK